MARDRGYRRQQSDRVIKNRKRLMKETGLEHKNCDQDNRYNKQHPYDCGNSGCLLCHGDKNLGFEKLDEQRIEDSYRDQTRDDFEGD